MIFFWTDTSMDDDQHTLRVLHELLERQLAAGAREAVLWRIRWALARFQSKSEKAG